MIKKSVLLILVIFFSLSLKSQSGIGVYKFTDLPTSSRLAAFGGTNISLVDNDINFAFQNPAMLSKETSKTIALNMANYLADIKFGSAIYSWTIGKNNYLGVGIQYVDYGKFEERSDVDEYLGEFTAKDMSLHLIYARPLTKNITVGGTLKPIYSAYERYTSFGFALDAGITYKDPKNLFSAGFVIRNVGTQFKGYYSDENGQHYESLPLNIQAGISKKLEHAPFRFSLNLHNLQTWNLNYISDVQTDEVSDISFFDMAARHAILGMEFLPSKNFYLLASYNYRRQQEMKMNGFKTMAGFSFGGGIKLYKFQVGFGMSQFQVGNYSYLFSISTSLNEFKL
jgi:hypothetical protein